MSSLARGMAQAPFSVVATMFTTTVTIDLKTTREAWRTLHAVQLLLGTSHPVRGLKWERLFSYFFWLATVIPAFWIAAQGPTRGWQVLYLVCAALLSGFLASVLADLTEFGLIQQLLFLNEPRIFDLEETHLDIHIDEAVWRVPWSAFRGVVQAKGFIFFFRRLGHKAEFLPKTAFATPEAAQAFVQYAAARILASAPPSDLPRSVETTVPDSVLHPFQRTYQRQQVKGRFLWIAFAIMVSFLGYQVWKARQPVVSPATSAAEFSRALAYSRNLTDQVNLMPERSVAALDSLILSAQQWRANLVSDDAREALLLDLIDFRVARENLSKAESGDTTLQRLRQQLEATGLDPQRAKEIESSLSRWTEHAAAHRRFSDAALRRQRYRMESWQGALPTPVGAPSSAASH